MDPNATKYPILSYLSRLSTFRSPKSSFDIEQPQHETQSPDEILSAQIQSSIRAKMPYLTNPEVIKSMQLATSDVSQTRSVLVSLGDRPDHETVDRAKAKILEIESKMEEIGLDDVAEEKEKEREKEKDVYREIVRVDEMHEAYEELLKEAESRLEKIYREAVEKGKAVVEDEEEEEEGEGVEMDEEVVKVLRGEVAEKVDLSERRLRILPEAFGRVKGLVAVNLSGNELKTLPDSIAGLEQLEELYLSSNILESLPESIGLMVNLKILDVSSNKLKVFPDGISHCRSLVELNAGYNSLAYLPTNIGYELVNLVSLSVQYNKLRSLPSSICEMKSLRYLDAHFNELHGLPSAIGRLTNLEILNLSGNFSDLRVLPESIGDLINLKELDVSNNQIYELPITFGRLDNLTKLNLDQNPIFFPPGNVVEEGVEAVKEYMVKRWLDILVAEEQNSRAEEDNQAETGWLKRSSSLLTRSTSVLNSWASTVSESVTEYLGASSPRDPYLNQQL